MKLYVHFLAMHLKSQMQYRVSFFLTLFAQSITAMTWFVGLWALMERFHQINGFSFGEVLLCFSVMTLAFSLTECFMAGVDRFPALISRGEFDRILLRPRGALLQVLCSQIDFARFGRIIPAVITLFVAIPVSGVQWSFSKVLLLAAMILSGVCVFTGAFWLGATMSFFFIEGIECLNIFTYGMREFGAYPLVIYGKGLLCFFTFIIPFAPVQYYPMLVLLGRSDSLLFGISPLLACLFLLPCFLLWKLGVRHYKSAGS